MREQYRFDHRYPLTKRGSTPFTGPGEGIPSGHSSFESHVSTRFPAMHPMWGDNRSSTLLIRPRPERHAWRLVSYRLDNCANRRYLRRSAFLSLINGDVRSLLLDSAAAFRDSQRKLSFIFTEAAPRALEPATSRRPFRRSHPVRASHNSSKGERNQVSP